MGRTLSNDTFRLVAYMTKSSNKFTTDADNRLELVGDSNSIFRVWYILSRETEHIEVYSLSGVPIDMTKGLSDMRSHGQVI